MNTATDTTESSKQENANGTSPAGAATVAGSPSPGSEHLTRAERAERWTETLAAVMLGIVAIATAWSGYQAARWGGVQSTKYARAEALRVESVRAANEAGQLVQIDIGLFMQWVNAYAYGNEELADFYYERLRPEFLPAAEAWLATQPLKNPGAPRSPFVMPEYKISLAEEAAQLEQEAAKIFDEGKDANQQSDDYILNAVILASVLFLGGIVTRFDWLPVRVSILIMALALLTVGLYNLATYPIY